MKTESIANILTTPAAKALIERGAESGISYDTSIADGLTLAQVVRRAKRYEENQLVDIWERESDVWEWALNEVQLAALIEHAAQMGDQWGIILSPRIETLA